MSSMCTNNTPLLVKCLYFVIISSLVNIVPANLTVRSPTQSQSHPAGSAVRELPPIGVIAYADATTTPFVSATAGSGDCPTSCWGYLSNYYVVYWSPLEITATITAETLVYVVNPWNNNTRTEIIINTEAQLGGYKKPNNTNSAGTQVETVQSWDGSKSVSSTITYPTPYTAYDRHYFLSGILPTTIAGNPTCIKVTANGRNNFTVPYSTFTFPSHPPVPSRTPRPIDVAIPTQVNSLDPRGWTYSAVYNDLACTNQDDLRPLFPDLGFWNCKQPLCPLPAEHHVTALYLTATSVSTEPREPTGADTAAVPITSAASVEGGASSSAGNPATANRVASTEMPVPTSRPSPASSVAAGPLVFSSKRMPNAPQPPTTVSVNPPAPPIIVNSQTISANPSSQYLLSSQTLIPGGPTITLGSGSSAQTVAIRTSQNAPPILVIDSSTSALQAVTSPPPPPIVIGNSETIIANSASQYIISPSQTLAVGAPPVMLAGSGGSAQVVALQTSGSGTYLVVGGRSSELGGPATTTGMTIMGVGGFAAGGFNGGGQGTSASVVGFTGGAARVGWRNGYGRVWWWRVGWGVVMVVMIMVLSWL